MSASKVLSDRVVDQDHLLRPDGPPDRVQHQKMVLGAFGVLRIKDDVPEYPFLAGETIAACRFSNGQPVTFADSMEDVRGLAVKFYAGEDEIDLLTTNEGGRSHARNAAEFVDFSDILAAKIAKGAFAGLKVGVQDLIAGKLGPLEAARISGILAEATFLHRVESLTTEAYWGSVVELAGRPIEYSFQPPPSTAHGTRADQSDPNFLRQDLLSRLSQEPILFDLCLQFFQDDRRTPVSDASIKWDAPLVTIGELEIVAPPKSEDENDINRMAFNPGNGFVALGITQDRKEIYAASARNRGALTQDEVRRLFRSRAAAGTAGT